MLSARGEIGFITEQKSFQPDPELSRDFAAYTTRYLAEYAAHLDDHRFRVGLIFQSHQPNPWGTETLLLFDPVVRMLYPVSGAAQDQLTAFQQKRRLNSIYHGIELLLEYALKDSPDVPIFVPVLFARGTTLGQYTAALRDALAAEDAGSPVIEVLNLIGPASAARKNIDVFVGLKERIHNAIIRKDMRKPLETKIMESMRRAQAPTSDRTPQPQQTIPADAMPPIGTATPTLTRRTESPHWYDPSLHEAICEKLQKFLTQPREYAQTDDIRNFSRFREFAVEQQLELASNCPIYSAPPGSALLDLGSKDQWNLYLLQGQIEVVAADGEKKIIGGGTENARNAIATLKPRMFAVSALTPVRFLLIHEKIIADIEQRGGERLKLL